MIGLTRCPSYNPANCVFCRSDRGLMVTVVHFCRLMALRPCSRASQRSLRSASQEITNRLLRIQEALQRVREVAGIDKHIVTDTSTLSVLATQRTGTMYIY